MLNFHSVTTVLRQNSSAFNLIEQNVLRTYTEDVISLERMFESIKAMLCVYSLYDEKKGNELDVQRKKGAIKKKKERKL